MTTGNNPIVKAFDLVAATREKKFLRSVFNPLAESKVTELKSLLTSAMEAEAARNNVSCREALLRASGTIDRYNALPATHSVPYRALNIFGKYVTGYRTASNPARAKTLKKMQRKLYKALKHNLPR